ncbi:hypothetical protein [Lewinella cohaerens]|uniref:hypothetical protein n=1 Tax=Lewinella cohaerens TaxID=70995 RepID=UPI00036B75BE|nr:hypothetical protein [Lewinella cohaerens]
MIRPTSTDFTEDLGEAIGYFEVFAERKIQIAKLDAAEKMASMTASLATGFILLALLPVFLCVLSVAVGFLLVESFGFSFADSFLLLSGVYLLLGLGLFVGRQYFFTNPIVEKVVAALFRNSTKIKHDFDFHNS